MINIEFVANDQQMIDEGIRRMQQLKIYPPIIEDFRRGKLWMSSNSDYIELTDRLKKLVENYEKASGNKIYHLVYSKLYGSETFNGLVISKYPEDWDYESPDSDGWTMSYSWNITRPNFTEMGSIQLKLENGVLHRIG